MRLWHIAKWVGFVLLLLVLAVGLARLFSGEEHDQPAGPSSPARYALERVVPWLILAAAVGGLVAGGLMSARSPATPQALERNLRFYGTVSIVATSLAVVLAGGLGLALAAGACCGPGELSEQTLFALLAVLGLLGFLALLGVHTHGTKKVLEAHYDLKRQLALLQETVERMSR